MGSFLTKKELQEFEELGIVGPFTLLDPNQVDSITKKLTVEKRKFFFANNIISRIPLLKDQLSEASWGKGKWHKGLHASAPLVYKLATESVIVDRIASIIGQDILLWSAMVLNVKPSDRNPSWHTDAELRDWSQWEGATAWLALSNVDEQSGMKVITRSHRLPLTSEEVRQKLGVNTSDDDAILQAAREFDPKCECVSVNTKPGEFFIFATRAWHTGRKSATQKVRNSVIFQYSKPCVEIKMPVHPDPPVVWDSRSLPCILVRGNDEYGKNRLVKPPKITA
ncbi:non-ribosomal peptide synthase [Dulcicalothrix desertica PCC 7102]|uniref:Non-ribosomal peptide synthase n=1 Tax=Dulcicalothrix desertica PCC 7102 TaxID=232991 RepID=A0A433V2D0_9CYAN|nr:phytanoyl-CoA dioxygenase family protein [Dulcicalothrix desertica]RUT00247.1 non-ribosomal peptide synthase [Dulcicalothrix desertica PCC 7102]TWH55714.1 Protein involved in biosynthesis of mitomycin antibiotics/polyketide fumonisin [Dulcicalothrix desertica PCC 7102]